MASTWHAPASPPSTPRCPRSRELPALTVRSCPSPPEDGPDPARPGAGSPRAAIKGTPFRSSPHLLAPNALPNVSRSRPPEPDKPAKPRPSQTHPRSDATEEIVRSRAAATPLSPAMTSAVLAGRNEVHHAHPHHRHWGGARVPLMPNPSSNPNPRRHHPAGGPNPIPSGSPPARRRPSRRSPRPSPCRRLRGT
ncbi:unnamed protein product [Miscanthus lutarioriparius]|uniref:Uncharacterized protein n=1 Tax=Miscanthus lutarioriparius TaxID=422564 RepID=A0A811SFQ7_9POAL|nr:unnamed protein product [Miscanthus lutarioriparius]